MTPLNCVTSPPHTGGMASYEWCPGLTLPRVRHGNCIGAEKAKRLLQLDAQGLSRRAIAERLGIHFNTVTNYLRLAGRPLHDCRPNGGKPAEAAGFLRARRPPGSELRRYTPLGVPCPCGPISTGELQNEQNSEG